MASPLLSWQAAGDWMISESEIRNWDDDQGLLLTPRHKCALQWPALR
jgi:hypothetical protein